MEPCPECGDANWLHSKECSQFDPLPTICHCGKPVMLADLNVRFNDILNRTWGIVSGYCVDCANVRCDAFPGACR